MSTTSAAGQRVLTRDERAWTAAQWEAVRLARVEHEARGLLADILGVDRSTVAGQLRRMGLAKSGP